MEKNILIHPNSFLYTNQGRFIYRSFVVDDASSSFGTGQQYVAGQHFWLFQPVFSHNKSC